ncbi:MAG TPA: gluconate 2-dehydrogenase subunit 3 family protein, partial [Edaphobacter sp.]|nr:gluconate 2-dehydrogenase subunit 3 family protein [Edaphobacter sp.]
MSTRRDALRILISATSVLPAAAATQQTKESAEQAGHLHQGPALKPSSPATPAFFQPEEFRTLEALSERIIPRTDTPGAKDAGVALLIDKALIARAPLAPQYRAGLADLNALAKQEFGKLFADLNEQQQIAVLTPLSLDGSTPLGEFFTLAKGMTVDAYYKTEAGLKVELGWHGNTFLS